MLMCTLNSRSMNVCIIWFLFCNLKSPSIFIFWPGTTFCQSKHSPTSSFWCPEGRENSRPTGVGGWYWCTVGRVLRKRFVVRLGFGGHYTVVTRKCFLTLPLQPNPLSGGKDCKRLERLVPGFPTTFLVYGSL